LSNAWVRCLSVRPQARVRLFCFPYAGAGASVYRLWPGELSPAVEVWAVQLPGRETRLHEPALTSMTAVVNGLMPALTPLLDRPFAFFGHSMGALVACELARSLQLQGRCEPALLMLSARRSPSVPDTDPPIHRLGHDDFVTEVDRRYGGIPKEVKAHRELMELLVPALQADMAVVETHRHAMLPLLNSPMHVFGGDADSRTRREDLQAWEATTCGAFRLTMLAGDHFFINSQRSHLLALVSESLRPVVAQTNDSWVPL
jgi:medium-chain acyl-[acyl-carrier-protein] hydrolase